MCVYTVLMSVVELVVVCVGGKVMRSLLRYCHCKRDEEEEFSQGVTHTASVSFSN